MKLYLRASGCHLPYGIAKFYHYTTKPSQGPNSLNPNQRPVLDLRDGRLSLSMVPK